MLLIALRVGAASGTKVHRCKRKPSQTVVVHMLQCNVTGQKPLNASELGLFKAAYTVGEALTLLPFGRSTLYGLIKRRELEVIHIGKRVAITAPAIVDLLNRLRETHNSQTGVAA